MTDAADLSTTPGFAEVRHRCHDGSVRMLRVIDREEPYPDGKLIVSRTDPAGVITHANQAFVDLSGYTREELIGQPHHILRHPDMPAAAFQDLWDTVGRGEKWQGYVKNLRKDGAHYWVLATVIPNLRHGVVVGYTSVRRKPSRRKVRESAELYARLRQKELSA
jgi:PAS domain S-box-containing protein